MSILFKDVAVIVPCYNEEVYLEDVLKNLHPQFNVICVDDGSQDRSASIAQAMGVTLLRHSKNLGQGAALQTGFLEALGKQYPYIATFDADGQHDVSDLIRMTEEIKKTSYDVILGSRFLTSSYSVPLRKTALLKMGAWITNKCVKIKLTDTHNGLRVFRRDALKKLCISEPGMNHATEIIQYIAQQGLSVKEMAVVVRYDRGHSSWYEDLKRSWGLGRYFCRSILNEKIT
ncbi:MAG: glycosyltransferase family 2 protein [Deltaproteobacteria bacterium]|nr:glycosyltransferase family 2 protein [Deltaproteobacteria bacterium]